MSLRRFVLSPVVLLLLAGLAATARPATAQTVMAAASMTDALNDLARQWVAQGHAAPTLVYGSSGALARQIAQGAPADLFISADTRWADFLARQDRLVPGSRSDRLGNALVLIVPGAAAAEIPAAGTVGADLAARLGDGRLAVGDPSSVPAGIYAKQALTRLGVWPALSSRLAPAADVRGVLRLVGTREAPLGIVYASDAVASHDVHVVGVFAADSHDPIVYPFALVRHDGTDPAAAKALFAFLTGSAAAPVYRRWGFTRLP